MLLDVSGKVAPPRCDGEPELEPRVEEPRPPKKVGKKRPAAAPADGDEESELEIDVVPGTIQDLVELGQGTGHRGGGKGGKGGKGGQRAASSKPPPLKKGAWPPSGTLLGRTDWPAGRRGRPDAAQHRLLLTHCLHVTLFF